MTAAVSSRYASAADGTGVLAMFAPTREPLVVGARDLRERAAALEALEVCAAGAPVVLVAEGSTVVEQDRNARLLKRSGGAVLSAQDTADVIGHLEGRGLHVWRVAGLAGSVFASDEAPAFHPRLVPISKHEDFPAAPLRKVRLLKADDQAKGGEDDGDAAAATADKQIVYGIVLEPEVVDSQGDIYSADEIEASCHLYLEDFQQVGHMHQTALSDASVRICESYIAPVDFTMGDQAVKKGSWVLALHVLSDGLWKQIKDGDLTGLSIGGLAQRVPVTDEGTEAAAG